MHPSPMPTTNRKASYPIGEKAAVTTSLVGMTNYAQRGIGLFSIGLPAGHLTSALHPYGLKIGSCSSTNPAHG